LAQCDYWWFAGDVEWCDMRGDSCKCGGWENACAFNKQSNLAQESNEDTPSRDSYRRRNAKFPTKHVTHTEQV
jgi:hypothetical protein